METKTMSYAGTELPVVNVTFNGEPDEDGKYKAEVVLRHGEAPAMLPELEPRNVKIEGQLMCVKEWLRTRVDCYDVKDSFVAVDRDAMTITLVTDQSDERYHNEVTGKLETATELEVLGINTGKVWEPAELALVMKMSRALFASKEENMMLVSQLMNFTADVNNKIERSLNEKGDRTDNFAQVVNSNLPKSFKLQTRLVKGGPVEDFEVETFAKVNGRDVRFMLLSPEAKYVVEEARDYAIDAELADIRKEWPELAVLEV